MIGGAACLWRDVIRLWRSSEDLLHPPWDGVVACNDAGYLWPGELAAWATLHAKYLDAKGWRAKREAAGFTAARRHFGHRAVPRGSVLAADLIVTGAMLPGQRCIGSSGLFAAKVALIDLGYERAILCGIPMSPTPHVIRGEDWTVAEKYRHAWLEVDDDYRARMRSMSGWTRTLFGPPESE